MAKEKLSNKKFIVKPGDSFVEVIYSSGSIRFDYGLLPKTPREICNLFEVLGPPQQAYKEFYNMYGISPTNAMKIIRGVYFRKVFSKVEDLVRTYGFSLGRVDLSKLRKIYSSVDKARQAQKDGLHNLLPLIVSTNRCPKGLKKYFGKSLWKTVSKNSHYRNMKIANLLNECWVGGYDTLPSYYKGFILDVPANKMHKVYLLGVSLNTLDSFKNLLCTLPLSVIKYIQPRVLTDICEEMESLNFSIIPKLVREESHLLEIHSTMSAEIRSRELQESLSKTAWESVENIKLREGEIDGVKFSLIDNAYDLFKEGERMSHCVYSYRNLIETGRYLVYKLEKGGQRATLGFRVVHGGWWGADQIYGPCNTPVKGEEMAKAPMALQFKLNEPKTLLMTHLEQRQHPHSYFQITSDNVIDALPQDIQREIIGAAIP